MLGRLSNSSSNYLILEMLKHRSSFRAENIVCVYPHLLVCTSVRSCFRGYCNPWFELHVMILGDSDKCFREETSGMIGKKFSKK